MTERWDEVADKLCQEVGAIWDCHQAIATALQSAYDAGRSKHDATVKCRVCYDAGHAAGVAQERTTQPHVDYCVCGHEWSAHFDHRPMSCKSCGCINPALRARETP